MKHLSTQRPMRTRAVFGMLTLSILLIAASCTKKETVSVPDSVPDMYYSAWTPASWSKFVYTDDYGGKDTGYTFEMNSADITQDIIDNGAILVYIKYAGVTSAYALPYTDPYSSLTWWFENKPGTINVNYAFGPAYGGEDPGAYSDGDIMVRFIVLRGGVPTLAPNTSGSSQGEALSAIPGSKNNTKPKNAYQQMSYDEVCELLGIPK